MPLFKKIIDSITKPRIPWSIVKPVKKLHPGLGKFLQYGRTNINTKEYWDAHWPKVDVEAMNKKYLALTERIIEKVEGGSLVLDVGCGGGQLLKVLSEKRNCRGVGIDISEVSIEIVRELGFDGFSCKLPDLPEQLKMYQFDVITCIETMEHLERPDLTFKAIYQLLKPGGIVIAAVPDESLPPEEYDEHLHCFSAESLSKLVSECYSLLECVSVKTEEEDYLLAVGRKDTNEPLS